MKVPLVWDMCDAETQSVQIANPKHVSQVFKMSWKRNFGRGTDRRRKQASIRAAQNVDTL